MVEGLGNFGEASEEVRVRDTNPVLHLKHDKRFIVYLTVAGLVDAGLSLKQAGLLVSQEYNEPKMEIASKAVSSFFENIDSTDGSDIVALANKSFGAKFLEPEERAVLVSLSYAGVDRAKVLRTAAEVVRNSPIFRIIKT